MPPRRKPTSTRAKKADQQLKRAIKRGDVSPPDPAIKSKNKRTNKKKARIGPDKDKDRNREEAAESVRKLQSAFVRLPVGYLEVTKELASNLVLGRPVNEGNAIYKGFELEKSNAKEIEVEVDHGDEPEGKTEKSREKIQVKGDRLTCPKRPKWKFDMSKNEVEKNEEGLFKKWILQTDQIVQEWQNTEDKEDTVEGEDKELKIKRAETKMPRSPSYFERNLEVWRQLWRVTEISQIILVLLDSRCPTLHFPPSLDAYLAESQQYNTHQARRVILVLTKVDITGPERVQKWTEYISQRYPGIKTVPVESYAEPTEEIAPTNESSTKARPRHDPSLPFEFRTRLVDAIKEAHEELLQPPERVASHPERLKNWVPPVRREINWKGVLEARGERVGKTVGGALVPSSGQDQDQGDDGKEGSQKEPEILTVGLIGQPNVGKSSLLNALFGEKKVRASKTPGKTKHFQTLYWTADVRLVDCPGLVMPNLVPMEMQVLSGILPISRVSAVPSCIYFAAQMMPLERILNLEHPGTKVPAVEDKRTWREGMKRGKDKKEGEEGEKKTKDSGTRWTAMDILTAFADSKGWVTAKAGRPDIHRAGNYTEVLVLRLLAEGRIPWGFWPPGTRSEEIKEQEGGEEGHGIWIMSGKTSVDEESEDEEAAEQKEQESSSEGEQEESSSSDEEETGGGASGGIGRFGALAEIESDSEDPSSGEE
ncbi:hypothetical protein BJ165DRAFT_1600225 [Panaeolus papilionaceus]|nr:hypothetical protein BJ165DRAFT_1600225 [Panaeolus papilionaceus]